MLDQIKKKRLNLTHSFDTNRPRISSTEKRKQIQANLQKFKKDVRESRPRSPIQSAKDFYQNNRNDNLNSSPTMKDLIQPLVNIQSPKKMSEQIQSPRFRVPEEPKQSLNIIQSLKQQPLQPVQQQNNQQQQKGGQQSPLKRSILKQQQHHDGQKLERQVSFGGQELKSEIKKANSPRANDPIFEPSYQRNEGNGSQLNFNYNQSNYGSSNGSSAIFFTSQFRDYINRQKVEENIAPVPEIQPITIAHQHKKSEPSEHHSQSHTHTDKQIGDSFLKMGQEEISQLNDSRSKRMLHNQSGRSLAFSNNQESNLRESKANQYVHDLVNKKLDEELVLEISHFGRNKFKDFVANYDRFKSINLIKQVTKQLKLLKGLTYLQKKVEINLKRYCFDGFLILNEYRFEELKNDIKADNYLKQSNEKLLKKLFEAWRNQGLEDQKKALINKRKKDEKMQRNIFQVFKMVWFDSKVKRQVDLYYLSKVFLAFKNAAASSRKKSDNQAMKQYCRSLKRRYFQKMQEGIEVLKRQRLNEDLAESHYRASLLKKTFDAWAEQCSRSPQYVSLTMTSKNVFKQTNDNKWFGIKTVDFKQLKP